MEKKKLVIVGDSAFAEIAREYFDLDSGYEVVAHAVEQCYLQRPDVNGLPVVPFENLENIYSPADHSVYVAVTYTQLNRLRARLARAAKEKGYALASYVSSRAFVWRNAILGEHVFIFEDNTIQPFVSIGNNVVLWSGNHIGHHSVIRDNVFVSSQVVISGFCDVGANSFLGVNATLANNVTLGLDNWLGPNTAVMKNTDAGKLFKTEHATAAEVSTNRFFRVPA
ncbi:acetyltransferase [Paraburkholderia sp. RCC_158]|uniref:acetyltransferase n=1 Tax=Paraburkholderia sp. RCC_158 TaxID=3239220 RepID=UPI003524DFBF